jgi:hypothetical protein
MLKYIMIPIWWVYAEMRFIKYRIRTDILKKPDRMGTSVSSGYYDITSNVIRRVHPIEFNIDENIRELRREYKKGNFKKQCLFT